MAKSKSPRKTKIKKGETKEVLPLENKAPTPVGRPTDFKEEYTQALLDYFGVDPTEEKQIINYAYGEPFEQTVTVATAFPSLAGFAVKIGVHRDTLHHWANAKDPKTNALLHPEFSDAYNRRKDFQENYILINGLSNKINPQFAMFAAVNLIDYRQKAKDEAPDTVVNNFDGLSDAELLAKAQELAQKIQLTKK